VDDLRGPLAEDMDAQQLQRIGVEEELEDSQMVTEDLGLGQFLVARDANLVPDLAGRQLLLAAADPTV
jgi:hypothetical protein